MTMKNVLLAVVACILLAAPLNVSAGKGGKMTKVAIETSKGTIVAELDSEKAPITVKNFVDYAKDGFFDGTI